MAATGRFTDQQVVNSFNLFIDTEKSSLLGDGNSKGDDVNIHFEGSTIVANDGEMIRMTLTNFEMFNNLYHIDANNSLFQTRCSTTTTPIPSAVQRDLTRKNYNSLGEITMDFANIIGNVIDSVTSGTHVVLITKMSNVVEGFTPYNVETGLNHHFPVLGSNTYVPISPATYIKPTPLSLGATGDRVFDVTYQILGTSSNTHVHGILTLLIQTLGSDGDCYCVLGSLRDDTDTASFNSFNVDLNPDGTNTQIRVRGFFPMQRMTDPYVYLRCGSSQNGSLEMAVLSDSAITASSNNSDITTSDIFAKLKRDVEFISYDNGMGDEYFINLQQRKLSSIRFTLTDSKNRKLGRKRVEGNNGTGAGLFNTSTTASDILLGRQYLEATTKGYTNLTQSTLGNLFFTAVVRVDIVKTGNPTRLETPALPLPLPARKAQNGVLTFEKYGMPKM